MPAIKKESISIELKPNQATEVKLAMPKDASVTFDWKSSGGGLNYDTHGDPVNAPKISIMDTVKVKMKLSNLAH
jgi:hypothetical protein